METNLNKDSQLPREYKTLKSKEPKADFPVVLNMSNSATLYLCKLKIKRLGGPTNKKKIITKIQKILLRRAMIQYIKSGGGIMEIDTGGPQTCLVAIGTQSSVKVMEDWYKKGLVYLG